MTDIKAIYYTIGMASTGAKQIGEEAYLDLLESGLNLYEQLQGKDENLFKPYFDIECKTTHCISGAEYNDCDEVLISIATQALETYFSGAQWCVLSASSPSYVCCKTLQTTWINSLHLIAYNYKTTKSNLANIVTAINKMPALLATVSDYLELDPSKQFQLFDESVYDSNRKIRAYGANKDNCKIGADNVVEDRPMRLVQGTVAQSVISGCFAPDTKIATVVPADRPPVRVKTENKTLTDKWQNLLFNVVGNVGHSRATWVKLAGWCKSHLDESTFMSFVSADWQDDARTMWASVKDIGIPIYWLQKYAKECNPVDYKQWLVVNDVYKIELDELEDPFRTAKIIGTTLKDVLVLCKENWFMLFDNNLWKQRKEPSHVIIKEIHKYIDASNLALTAVIANASGAEKEKLVEKSKAYLAAYKKVQSSGHLNVLTKCLRTILDDESFADKLDNNPEILAFKNGVMDLKTKKFRAGICADDYLTDTLPYEYAAADTNKTVWLKKVLLKILNNNSEHLEYFLSLIGFSFIGSPHLQKSLYFCVDKTMASRGDNGKTFWFDILTTLCPNLVYKTNKSFLEADNKKVHKQLSNMKGKRLVWMDEFDEKKTNAELMKVIGEGTKYENEVMYGTSEEINIMFKLWTLTNHMPNIEGRETAVYNRYKQISYGSHFDRTGAREKEDASKLLFIADTGLGDQIKTEYINEVYGLIIDYAHSYFQTGIPKVPDQFVRDAKETQKNNDAFGLFFDEHIILDINFRMPLKALVERSKMSEKLVKEGMKRLGYAYDKDLSKMGKDSSGKTNKGGYVGCMLAPEEEEEEE